MKQIIEDILTGDLLKTTTIIELLKIYFATSALVTALFTLYAKDNRLRAISENILVTLIFFLSSTIFILISLFITNLHLKSILLDAIIIILNYTSLLIYILTLIGLLFYVFLRSYNQIYNLRVDKVWRYFKPVKFLYRLRGHKRYELHVNERKINENSFEKIKHLFSKEEILLIAKGASILITGEPTDKSKELVLDILKERIEVGETANYISADFHPFEIWTKLKAKLRENYNVHKDCVFIDAFTPSFGFTDEIYEDYSKQLELEGVKFVEAKTFAGIHSNVAVAFNLIKKDEKKQGRGNRRPMTIVYSQTSALCDFESTEQFRIFWRHVISSERIYGMTLFILEDKLSTDEILNPLKQRVDFILSFDKFENGELKLSRLK
jgi:hypothetical protein